MILVTGGTGFVGQEIVKQLQATGNKVRLLLRNPEALPQNPLYKNCELVQGDILDPACLLPAMQGVQAIIHLVGIIIEKPGATFEKIHAEGTANLVTAARIAGVPRFVHMSALNTKAGSASQYHQTKWLGELAVRESGLDWTIFQPSVIYGPGDGFVSQFAQLMQPPFSYLTGFSVPSPGDGETILQPVHVQEVARAFVRALANPNSISKTYQLGGESLSFNQFLTHIALALHLNPCVVQTSLPCLPFFAPVKILQGYRPVILPLPGIFFRLIAGLTELFSPIPVLSYDQAIMLEESHYADTTAAQKDLGFQATPFSENIKKLLQP
jgi:uncharacterized protein YbjT (DUF2867 family)